MNEYLKAVEKKLKKRGLSEEEIGREIKKIIDPNFMEEETPVVPVEPVEPVEVPTETPVEVPPLDTEIKEV